MILLSTEMTMVQSVKKPTKSQEMLMLDEQLCFALHSASNAIDNLYRPRLAEHELTYSQYITLMSLANEDNVSITQLASRVGLGKATMTPLLRSLDEKGLVTRTTVAGNERQKVVVLTEAGLEALQGSCYVTENVFSLTGLTAKEADVLISLCKKIAK